jgi:thymidylate synthase (FAD)
METEVKTSVTDILGDGIAQIDLIDFLGGDLAAVNGARASFASRKAAFDDKDAKLLARLGRDIHHTPLRHSYFQFYIEAPEALARQWYKHCVGTEYAFKDLPWSEFSQRYKEVPAKLYIPREFRQQSGANKQASCGAVDDPMRAGCVYRWVTQLAVWGYHGLLKLGVAREQARFVLPTAIYTSWVWTASLQAIVHFCALRDHPGAQWEIQQFAKALQSLVQPLAPHSWDALWQSHPLVLTERR